MDELSPVGGSEGYEACGDAVTLRLLTTAPRFSLSCSGWAHGRVDKPSDSGQTRFGPWPHLGFAHPLPSYPPYVPALTLL